MQEPRFAPFKPILDRVIVKRVEEQTDDDSIVISKKYRQHSNKGIVVAVGDFVVLGGERVALSHFIKVGDRVLFGEYNAEKFLKDGEELNLVRIQDIRGIEPVLEKSNG